MTQTGLASEAARIFLAQNTPEGPPPSAETIDTLRAEFKADFIPRAERALARYKPARNAVSIEGVPCIEIIPGTHVAGRTILYFYGGGYITGSALEDLIVAVPLAHFSGARVVLPEYSLAPEHPFPAAVDQGFAVYRALADTAPAIAGESAGGNLALVTMQRARRAGLPLPRAAALLSPWCDLANDGDSLTANDGRDPTESLRFVQEAARLYAGGADLSDPEISPVLAEYDTNFPPTIITTGTRDLLLSHSVRLARVLRETGVETDLRVWDALWHVFEFYDELPEAERSLRDIAAFIAARLQGATDR